LPRSTKGEQAGENRSVRLYKSSTT
jgi:hypothetical protein